MDWSSGMCDLWPLASLLLVAWDVFIFLTQRNLKTLNNILQIVTLTKIWTVLSTHLQFVCFLIIYLSPFNDSSCVTLAINKLITEPTFMFLLSLIKIASLHLNVSFQTFILNQMPEKFYLCVWFWSLRESRAHRHQAGWNQLVLRLTRCHWLVWTSGSPALHQYNKTTADVQRGWRSIELGRGRVTLDPKLFSCVQEHEWNSVSCNCTFAIAAYGDADWLVWYQRFLLHKSLSFSFESLRE